VLELSGLFRDSREASLVFTQLARSGTLSGYADFLVVGAFVSAAAGIHSRQPVASIEDLKNLTVRVNNSAQADVLQRFGAIPALLAINQTTNAVSRGAIAAAAFPPSMLYEFGVGRVTSHHFMMAIAGAPTALVMNRQRFEALPQQAKSIIAKNSGEKLAERSAAHFAALDQSVLKKLQADAKRTVTLPSSADEKAIQKTFSAVVDEFSSSSDRNRELLARVKTAIAALRATE
jgi:TRAP-type C4-dicarboxylate transport system substrate-binding protein